MYFLIYMRNTESNKNKFKIMRALKYLFLLTIFMATKSFSQVATNYTFSETTGTYTTVTSGTQLVTSTANTTTYDTDGSYFSLASGNQFTFNGTVITAVSMTTDGALWLNPGTSTVANGVTGSIASTSTATGIICPLNMDLTGSGVASTVFERRWYDDGTELIFQWQNCARYLQPTEKISFQVRINKSTGVIRVVYGSMTVTTSTTYQPYVGLRGSANTDYNNRRLTAAIPDASPGWAGSAGTAAGTSNAHTCRFLSTASCFPSSGLIFIWTPKPVITPSVSTLSAFSSCSGSVSSTQNFTVTGSNMLAGITITPPVGFEVSTSSTFASSIGTSSSALVVGAAGTIASTTIYVRLQSTASTGSPSGNITLVSTSATTKNVAVSGTVGVNLSAVVVSSSTTQSICLGSDGTSVSVAETGGGTITSRQWGRRSISGGAITNVTGTSSSYTPLGTDFTTVGTYYLVCTSTPTCGSATVSNEVTITIVGSPATPGVPTTNSPQCISPGVTLTANGSAPAGETWYWQTTSTGVATTSSSSTYVATTSGTYYIRSVYTSGGCWGVSSSAAIVISTVPSTPTLTSPTNASTGVSLTPTLTWPAVSGATSYDVYLGTTLPGSPTANVLTNSYTPSTLAASTSHSWKVIAKNACGSSTSSSTYTFTTACGSVALTYTQLFNATTIPSCWSTSIAAVQTATKISYVASSTNTTALPQEGADFVKYNSFSSTNGGSGSEERLITPAVITTGTSSVDVEFYWYQNNGSSYNTGSYLNEGVTVEWSTNGTTWTTSTFYPRQVSSASATGEWSKKTITLPAGAGNISTLYVAFKFHSEYGYNMYIDNVVIKPTPSCAEPTSLTSSSITTTTSTISWTASSSSPSGGYDYYLSTSSTAPTGSSTPTGSVGSGVVTTNLSSLSSSTLYYYWVRSNCGSSSYSTWTGSTFTTLLINDNSDGAIDVPINPSTTCTTTTTGTSVGATQTLPAQSLYGTADDDVWYKFTATAVSLDMSVTRGTMNDLVVEAYTSSLVSLGVVDNYSTSPEIVSFTNLTIGDVYYIRVYSYAATVGSRGTFIICITTPTQPPSNDNASGAITLIVNDPYITGTNDGATSSTTAPTPNGPSYFGGDIWYKVVVPSNGIIQIHTSALVLTDVVVEVYSGTSSALTYITYNDDSSSVNSMSYIELTGRTSGETIWIRVWDYDGDNTGTFKIRVTTPVSLPIELLSFSADCSEGGVLLTWITASELNSDYFNIERSRDGVNWSVISTISGAGNSNSNITYNVTDKDIFGINSIIDNVLYYQLKQVDFDGVVKNYGPISTNCLKSVDGYFTVYPNPSNNSFNIMLNNDLLIGESLIKITDQLGRLVYNKNVNVSSGINLFILDKLDINTGVYYISIVNGDYSTGVVSHVVR